MKAISEAANLIEHDPLGETARIFSSLILALESGSDYAMSTLYALDIEDFNIALALIPAWRRQNLRTQKESLLKLASVIAQKSFVPKPIQVREESVGPLPRRGLIGEGAASWSAGVAH